MVKPDVALIEVLGWSGQWSYYNHIPDLREGDYVVVTGPEEQLKFGRVISLKPPEEKSKYATKWLVDRVDMDKYRALKTLAPHEVFTEGEAT